MKKKTTAQLPKDPSTQAITIADAEQLQRLCQKPMRCAFRVDGQLIELQVHRLSAAAEETVRSIRRSAQPPWDQARGDYDRLNQKYLNDLDNNERLARSFAVYAGCPIVAASKPGLTNRNEIHGYVQTLFSEYVLEIIYATITAGGITLEERANFTSTPGSES